MKTTNLLILSLAFLMSSSAMTQNIISTKEFIYDVGANTTEYAANGQIDEAEKYLEDTMQQCLERGQDELCVAGLNFAYGYLYQKAAKADVVNRNTYLNRAETYYKRVLDVYPDNQAARSNLAKVMEEIGESKSTIRELKKLAKRYPAERVNYLVRIGDLYKKEYDLGKSCKYYREAYKEDPFSVLACGRMVDLYTRNDFSCISDGSVREFALDCQEIDLPNYSEELLRAEFTEALVAENYEKAMESLILWTNVMAENGWLDAGRLETMKDKLFPGYVAYGARDINKMILELIKIIKTKDSDNLWSNSTPSVSVSGAWNNVTPKKVFLKILRMKGQKAYVAGDQALAEDFWQTALYRSEFSNKAFYIIIATDLAQLYHANPSLDPGDKKLDELVYRLFDGKEAAYGNADFKMIRKYHIVLGSIFYNKKIWDGSRYANAEFQLERALWSKFGPIVNPKLRTMLGDVYIQTGNKEKAVDAYALAIQDFLSIDRIKDAETLHATLGETYRQQLRGERLAKYQTIEAIIGWRNSFKNPLNELQRNTIKINDYLKKVNEAEIEARKTLPADFVQLQFFKGLSDLGGQMPDDRKKEQQMLYTNALEKISNVETLSTTGDFRRIQNIKIVLEESVVQSNELERTQIQKKAKFDYSDSEVRKNFKTYRVPTSDKEIMVPDQLFQLNETLNESNRLNTTTQIEKLKLQNGEFRKVNN